MSASDAAVAKRIDAKSVFISLYVPWVGASHKGA